MLEIAKKKGDFLEKLNIDQIKKKILAMLRHYHFAKKSRCSRFKRSF